jgi:A/G-specific adenine glycosylase
VEALAGADLSDVLKLWAGLGYYARARNLHACAKALVEQHGGEFPGAEEGLRALPGIGAYTAAAIAAIAFDEPASPVDGNIERVIARLFVVEEELPAAKPRIRALAESLTPARRAGDFAQAMMDLGATICTPKKPACALCPWMASCAARVRGDQDSFPRKAEKKTGALRRGAAFVAVRADGFILLRTRPEKGLLGGMAGAAEYEKTTNTLGPATMKRSRPVAWNGLMARSTMSCIALVPFPVSHPPGLPTSCRFTAIAVGKSAPKDRSTIRTIILRRMSGS